MTAPQNWETTRADITGTCEQKQSVPPKKNDSWAYRLSKHQIKGWIAAPLKDCKATVCSECFFPQAHTHTHTHTLRPFWLKLERVQVA